MLLGSKREPILIGRVLSAAWGWAIITIPLRARARRAIAIAWPAIAISPRPLFAAPGRTHPARTGAAAHAASRTAKTSTKALAAKLPAGKGWRPEGRIGRTASSARTAEFAPAHGAKRRLRRPIRPQRTELAQHFVKLLFQAADPLIERTGASLAVGPAHPIWSWTTTAARPRATPFRTTLTRTTIARTTIARTSIARATLTRTTLTRATVTRSAIVVAPWRSSIIARAAASLGRTIRGRPVARRTPRAITFWLQRRDKIGRDVTRYDT